jgi:hypothetical protein
MVSFEARIILCLIWGSYSTQLPRIRPSQFPVFDTQGPDPLSKLESTGTTRSLLAVWTSGITMVRTKRTSTSRGHRQEAREVAIAQAVKKAKGGQAAQALYLKELECKKELEE